MEFKIKAIVPLLLCTTFFTKGYAQPKEGTIYYSIETVYPSVPDRPNELAAPSEPFLSAYRLDFNSDYIRKTSSTRGQTNTIVEHKTTDEILVALYSEKDYSISYYKSEEYSAPADIDNSDQNRGKYHDNFYIDLLRTPLKDTVVLQTNETKNILGYSCRKTIVKIPDGDLINVWTTDSLPGLEQYERVHPDVKGTMLQEEFISKYFRFDMEVTGIDYTNKINEKELIPFPENAVLELGTTYLDNGKYSKLSVAGFDLPDFLDHSGFETDLKKINDVLLESKEMKAIDGNTEQQEALKLEFGVDRKGKILEIAVSRYGQDATSELTNTIAQLLKKCTFKPITVYDKAVPFQFTIYYHFDH